MTLPTFVGIGAQKAGTTWLHHLLDSHPSVLMPSRRKEIHYFDWHYHKGQDWYEAFFSNRNHKIQAVGEITPDYMYDERCADRIATLLPEAKLIAILRDPVTRAYSQYKMNVAEFNWSFGFGEAVRKYPDILERGYYDKQLKPYFEAFPKENILILIFEEAVSAPETTKRNVAEFLGVELSGFPKTTGQDKIYSHYQPKHRRLFAAAKWLSFQLHKYDFDGLVEGAKSLGVKRIFGRGNEINPLTAEDKHMLHNHYQETLFALEALLGRPVSMWNTSMVSPESSETTPNYLSRKGRNLRRT